MVDLVNVFLSLWLKPMILMALALSLLKSRYVYSAASGHWFLLSALCVMFIASPMAYLLQGIPLYLLPESLLPFTQIEILASDGVSTFFYCIFVIYVLGAMWILFFQLFSYSGIRSLSSTAVKVDDDDVNRVLDNIKLALGITKNVRLLQSNFVGSPIVWGHFSPTVIMPLHFRDWRQERVERVLIHELSHIHRCDWAIKMMTRLVCALFWPVPLVWYVAQKIEWYGELSCDDKVIFLSRARCDYAEDLLSLSGCASPNPCALSLIKSSKVYLRVAHVLDGRNERAPLSLKTRLVNFFACMCFIVPVSAVSVLPSVSEKPAQIALLNFSIGDPALVRASPSDANPLLTNTIAMPLNVIHQLPKAPEFYEELVVTARDIHLDVDPDVVSPLTRRSIDSPYVEMRGFLPSVAVTPIYPIQALRKGLEGKVVVRFDVDENGRVVDPKIVKASLEGVFDKAVLKALKQSKYQPMFINGRAITVKNMIETFLFKMSDSTASDMSG